MNKSISILSILVIVGMVATTTSVIMSIQSAMAFPVGSCAGCAKDFAPGQLSKDNGLPAKDFAPGQEGKIIPVPCSGCNGASDFAPGQLKKDFPVPTCDFCNGASQFAPGHLKKQTGG